MTLKDELKAHMRASEFGNKNAQLFEQAKGHAKAAIKAIQAGDATTAFSNLDHLKGKLGLASRNAISNHDAIVKLTDRTIDRVLRKTGPPLELAQAILAEMKKTTVHLTYESVQPVRESLLSDTERLSRRIEVVMREVNTHRGRVHREVGLNAGEADSYLAEAEDHLEKAFGQMKKVEKLV